MALLGAIGGIIGREQGREKEKQAERTLEDALRAMKKVKVPTIESQEIDLLNPELVGTYSPELEQALSLGDTEMGDISLDPRLRSAQMQALEQLSGISQEGLTDADMAALRQMQRAASSQEQAKQQQILQEMQQRGQGGSGAELAARLASAQSSADRLGADSLEIAKMAQQRALEAMAQSGSLASQVRGQDYGQAADAARAQDVINQFNTQNQQSVQQRNVGSKNQAQQQNLAERQRISDTSKDVQNQQEMYNKGLVQQNFQNQMAKATGVQAPLQNMANMYSQQGVNIAQHHAQQGQAMDKSILSAVGMGMSDKNIKVNINDGSQASRDFLDKLSPKTYQYAPEYEGGPFSPEGQHLGIMAQDLEKTGPVGESMVKQGPMGEKIVDYGQGFGTILANQADLNDRLKRLESLLMEIKNVR